MRQQSCDHRLDEAGVREWISKIVARDRFDCQPMPLSQSTAWSLRDGALRHRTNRFFTVVGLSWEQGSERFWRPFIDQREIGTLAFAVRESLGDIELLCHAKAEPGNVGTVQIAPTYQATASNTDKVHGGEPPPYADYFTASKIGASASLQSEQGSRFYHKRNNNMMLLAPELDVRDAQHCWLPSALLRSLLDVDFLINTDARSVLVSSDWRTLTRGEPFSSNTPLARDLKASFGAEIQSDLITVINMRLDQARLAGRDVQLCRVDSMPGWPFSSQATAPLSNGSQSVQHIRVHSETREISDWDQPIFSTHSEAEFILLCGRQEGTLKFAFRTVWEPGLMAGAELAPSVEGPLPEALQYGHILASVRQSDEGGRFFNDVARYSLMDIGSVFEDDDRLWLTLSEIQHLLPLGYFNNEARSLLSLVLRFL